MSENCVPDPMSEEIRQRAQFIHISDQGAGGVSVEFKCPSCGATLNFLHYEKDDVMKFRDDRGIIDAPNLLAEFRVHESFLAFQQFCWMCGKNL